MPHLLIRTADEILDILADGSTYTISGVTYTVPKWNGRVAGDEILHLILNLLSKNIDIFFLEQIGFLSGDIAFMREQVALTCILKL